MLSLLSVVVDEAVDGQVFELRGQFAPNGGFGVHVGREPQSNIPGRVAQICSADRRSGLCCERLERRQNEQDVPAGFGDAHQVVEHGCDSAPSLLVSRHDGVGADGDVGCVVAKRNVFEVGEHERAIRVVASGAQHARRHVQADKVVSAETWVTERQVADATAGVQDDEGVGCFGEFCQVSV